MENGYIFKTYDLFSEYIAIPVMINDVTPSDIESGELEKLLEDAKNYVDPELDKSIKKGDEKPEQSFYSIFAFCFIRTVSPRYI